MTSYQAYMEHLLHCGVQLYHVPAETFEPGFVAKTDFTKQARLLHIIAGRIRYEFALRSVTLGGGAMLFVPSGVERTWSVTGDEPLSMEWFLYTTTPDDLQGVEPRVSHDVDQGATRQSFERLRQLSVRTRPIDQLAIAGECKTLLMRFMHESVPLLRYREGGRGTRSQLAVNEATQILDREYAKPDVLTGLHERVAVSENHFRTTFRRAMGMTPGQYVLRVRMRHARDLLGSAANLTIKQVAARMGYDDPFYFSRVYRQFWGHPPSDERTNHA